MDCGVPKIDVLLFKVCESIVAHAVEQEFFVCFLRAEVVGVQRLFFLVACDDLLTLCRAYVGAKCRSLVDPRISWCCVDPRRIVDYDAVFCLWYNCGKEAVSLPFDEVGGLQDCKCPAQLVFKGVDRLGRDDARNLCDGVFLGNEHDIRTIF